MDWKPFWRIIDDAYRPSGPDHFEALKGRLGDLKWFELVEFQARFDELTAAANTIDLNTWRAVGSRDGGEVVSGF